MYAAAMSALINGTPEIPGGPCYGSPTMPVGSPANAPHLKWTDASYMMGCQTNFELGAYRHRYACALSRTVFLGEPTARAKHLHQAALDGFLAQVDAIRPGVKCSDIHQAFQRAFKPMVCVKSPGAAIPLGSIGPTAAAAFMRTITRLLRQTWPSMSLSASTKRMTATSSVRLSA